MFPAAVAVRDDGTIIVASLFGPGYTIAPQGTLATISPFNCGSGYLGPGLCMPAGIALDASGDIVATDRYCRVRKVLADGQMFTIAGADIQTRRSPRGACGYADDGGRAIDAKLLGTYGIAADRHGNVFVADSLNACIRRVDASGTISTFAGQCLRAGFAGDGGPATAARLYEPRGVAVDEVGNVYIADTRNLRIRKVGVDGIITTVAGNGDDFPAASATGLR